MTAPERCKVCHRRRRLYEGNRRCRPCQATYYAGWYRKNRVQRCAQQRARHRKHRAKENAWCRRWAATHRREMKAYRRAYYARTGR